MPLPHDALRSGASLSDVAGRRVTPVPLTGAAVGELFRCSLGLSAWKSYGASRWALRVNPSSGNLHPTEGYVLWDNGVFHYAADAHALEQRAVLPRPLWPPEAGLLVGLSSIHWREAWKYGERAYRYCQHDIGHALAAVRYAAGLLGWRATILTGWSDSNVATLLGLDRDADFEGAEREVPACLLHVAPSGVAPHDESDPGVLVAAARAASWRGTANRLSPAHVEWPIIDAVAAASWYPGSLRRAFRSRRPSGRPRQMGSAPARDIILRRRSALGFDPNQRLSRDAFQAIVGATAPDPARIPWDMFDAPPFVHLVLFVHRVEGLLPGVYVYPRDPGGRETLRAAMRSEFLWEPSGELFLLVPTDVTQAANRLSCDQDIAGDGYFSLGMLAHFEAALADGDWRYRRLFWECGAIGQVLYLEAEAHGARGTGIGCFYDDPVHEALGLSGAGWQSLYHFAVGAPVDDTRLTTEPGYEWDG